MSSQSKIPVTIITGFLGAGKTTFINALLRTRTEQQFALVENEFGEVAIDPKLIKGVDASQMFELKQGCICCTISDEYELVLQELAEKFPHIDHLLIETTGIADPSPVIQPFFRDNELKQMYHFNGTICLLDALNYDGQAEQEIRLKQLALADLVLVSKAEKLSSSEKTKWIDRLSKLNPFAHIRFSAYGEAEFQLECIQTKKRTEFDLTGFKSIHTHIQTKILRFEKPLEKAKFLPWLEYTLDIHKNKIYRTKGIVRFIGEPFEYIIQGVGGGFEVAEGDFAIEGQRGELVFIGNLDRVALDFGC